MSEVPPKKVQAVVKRLFAQAARARVDPAAFFEFVMVEEFTGKPLKIAPHQQLFFDFVTAHPRCVVRAFAGASKTYMVSALTLFKLGQDSSERGVILSATVGQAKKPVGMVRRYIEDGGRLALVFPKLMRSPRPGDSWTQTQLVIARERVIRDPSLTVCGIGGKLPGARISWANADDLLTLENTLAEAQREHTFTWMGSTVIPRLDTDDSHIVVTNTPWFPTDLTYQLEKGMDGADPWPSLTMEAHGDVIIRNTEWDSPLVRPAMTDDPRQERCRLVAHDHPRYAKMVGVHGAKAGWVDEADRVPLWPEKWNWEQLEARRKIMPASEYNRTMRCIVRDKDSERVKTEWIDACKDAAKKNGADKLVSQWGGDHVYTGVDPAFGLSAKHDRSCIFTFCVLPTGHRRILDVKVGRWRSSDMVDRIIQTSQAYGSLVCVEGNSAQKLIRDWAREKNVNVMIRARDTTGKNKMDPRFGIESIFHEVERGAWLIPSDAKGAMPAGVADWVQDLFDYEPDQHTGDVLMASWIAREQARRRGAFAHADAGGLAGLSSR